MEYQTLNLLLRCSKEFGHKIIRSQSLSDTECMICSYIYSHNRCSQDDVSIALKTDKTTVGKALAALEAKGCVTRTVDKNDRRIKRLSLTVSGRDKITKLINIHDNWLTEIMSCLSAAERKQFENYCERLLAAADMLKHNSGGSTI